MNDKPTSKWTPKYLNGLWHSEEHGGGFSEIAYAINADLQTLVALLERAQSFVSMIDHSVEADRLDSDIEDALKKI